MRVQKIIVLQKGIWTVSISRKWAGLGNQWKGAARTTYEVDAQSTERQGESLFLVERQKIRGRARRLVSVSLLPLSRRSRRQIRQGLLGFPSPQYQSHQVSFQQSVQNDSDRPVKSMLNLWESDHSIEWTYAYQTGFVLPCQDLAWNIKNIR